MSTREDTCAHCGQKVVWRHRALNSSMARTLCRLLWMERKKPGEFVHVPSLPGDNHEVSQLAWWGFVEPRGDMKADGNPNSGYWRITAAGVAWASGGTRAPSHAWTFNARYQKPELDGSRMITIREVRNFNYDELIAGWGR